MKSTYRKWKDTNKVFFLKYFNDGLYSEYFCEAEWWEDSFYFDTEMIGKESIEATENEIKQYKINKKKYDNE